LANFVGFAFVPSTLQPTYMSSIQFFWQIYISSVAAGSGLKPGSEDEEDRKLAELFNEIDADKSGYLDAHELKVALKLRGIEATLKEVDQMIADADKQSAELGLVSDSCDGRVSLTEFKFIAKNGSKISSADLWEKVRKPLVLEKGVKKALQRYAEAQKLSSISEHSKEVKEQMGDLKTRRQELSQKQESPSASPAPSAPETPKALAVSEDSQSNPPVGVSVSVIASVQLGTNDEAAQQNPLVKQVTTIKGPTLHPSHPHLGADMYSQTHTVSVTGDEEVRRAVEEETDKQWLQARSEAVRNAQIGGLLLCVMAFTRRVIFKI
jgi:hypothetical protein